MRRSLRKAACAAGLLALVAGGSAYGLTSEIGNSFVSATATLQPRELPDHGGAPVTLSSVTRIGTRDGSPPPVLKTLEFLVDKHGFLDAGDWPRCTLARLADTTPAQARKRCAGALVGKGIGRAVVNLPGQPQMRIQSRISLFNGPPAAGRPTLIAHAYETVPAPKTLLVPIAIERVHHGRYGYRARIELPEIAAGYGSPTLAEATLGATRERGGKTVGYLNARCSGGRLQVYGTLSFDNGDFFPATLTSPCHTPG